MTVLAVNKVRKAGEKVEHGHNLDTLVRTHYGRYAKARVTKRNPNGTAEVMVTRPGDPRKQGTRAEAVVATLVVRAHR
jgi:hypothetical protein